MMNVAILSYIHNMFELTHIVSISLFPTDY